MIESFCVYKLHFTSPVHLGDARDDYGVSLKTIPSDMMYSALISSLAKIGKTIPVNGDLGFSISSLFPFYQKGEEKPIYFFPKPMKNVCPQIEQIDRAKIIKKVEWLDTDAFSKILQANYDCFNNSSCCKDVFLTSKSIHEKFIESQISVRVKVSRTGKEEAIPFYMDRVYFKYNSGLFFIAKGDTSLLDQAIDILQYEGIGTDRNVGNGFFIYSKDCLTLDFPDCDSTDYALSLSTFIPESKEQLTEMLSGNFVGYDFMRRGGWITTPPFCMHRKKTIYSFIPGSIFHIKIKSCFDIKGKIVDLNPDITKVNHPIWRTGKSLFIPIKL